MKEQTKISLLASVLLAVFLPMVILTSVHVHHSEVLTGDDVCVKCVQHVPHATHFSAHIVKIEHCLFCHFLGLTFLTAAVAAIAIYKNCIGLLPAVVSCHVTQPLVAGKSPRGPPLLF